MKMKATGIVRRVDVLGRVVVPKEIRKILGISEGDPLEIFTEKDGIILKKYSPLSNMDEIANDVAQALSRQTGKCVFICDKDVFLSASGLAVKEILDTKNVNLNDKDCDKKLLKEYVRYVQSETDVLQLQEYKNIIASHK
jgi:AbrB family transcriptional regulator (stage V sporulation protein T)